MRVNEAASSPTSSWAMRSGSGCVKSRWSMMRRTTALSVVIGRVMVCARRNEPVAASSAKRADSPKLSSVALDRARYASVASTHVTKRQPSPTSRTEESFWMRPDSHWEALFTAPSPRESNRGRLSALRISMKKVCCLRPLARASAGSTTLVSWPQS